MSSNAAVEEAFFTSFGAVAQVLAIIFAGAVSTSQGLLPPLVQKSFATFNLKVFLPSLILSTAASYDALDLVRYAPLLLAATLHILLGLTLGALFGKLFNLHRPDRHFLLLMTAFNANGELPFILLVPLCETWRPALDEGPSALGRAYGMVMIYCLPMTVLVFTLGVWIIKDAAKNDDTFQGGASPMEMATSSVVNPLTEGPPCVPDCEKDTRSDKEGGSGEGTQTSTNACLSLLAGEAPLSSMEKKAKEYARSAVYLSRRFPALPLSFLAMALACSGPVKAVLFSGPLAFVGGSWKQLGACAPVISAFVLSAGLYSSLYPPTPSKENSPGRLLGSSSSSSSSNNSETENSNLVNLQSGTESMVDRFTRSVTTEAMVELMKMDDENHPIVNRPGQSETEELAAAGEETRNADAKAKWRLLVLLSSGLKLVLMPLVCFPLTRFIVRRTGFAEDDKMLQMILLIECAVPSSQTAVALMQLETSSQLANRFSSFYLPMYCAAAFTLSFWVAAAIYLLQ